MSDDVKESKKKVERIGDESKNSSETFKKPSAEDSPLYYGVCLFSINGPNFKGNPDALVFSDKKEALQTVKEYSGARFKVFTSREDAESFSKSSCSTPRSLDLSLQESPVVPRPAVGEKPSSFKAPRSQDMVKLRKAIECGDAEYFTKVVWANPRYLVSCGDTPAILQEGFRYNALHIAAKHNQGSMCSLILCTLEDVTFLPVMYPDDTTQVTQQRRKFIVDLYLNMPEKGLCETPLHFSCKFGCVKVAEVLLRHPSCNTLCQNKYGKTPREIICDRNGSADARKQIEAYFEATYYVRILRSEDNSVQATVDAPYCLSEPENMEPGSPFNPALSVKARAGPMTSTQADSFYKKLRMSSNAFAATLRDMAGRDVRRTDSRKGLERIGRSLASEMNVPWNEYWSFMDDWTDLTSAEGLQKLEGHLKDNYYNILTQGSDVVEEKSNENLESSDALSPVSQLCRQLEGFHLDSSLNTSPDTPALFSTGYVCSSVGSSCSSSSLNECSLGSPELRTRPGFHKKKNSSFDYKCSTPTIVPKDTEKIKARNNGGNRCFELICTYLVSFITDTVNIVNNKQLTLVSDSIVPIFDRYFCNKISHDVSAFHGSIAKEVVRRLEEELLQQRELVLALNNCDFLMLTENNDDSSSDDDQPSRNQFFQQCKLEKQCILRNHVRCVLSQIKNLMDSQQQGEIKCQCSWEQLDRLRKDDKKEENGCHRVSGEESSEDEFFTPPNSQFGSPHSSIGEAFTPDEGLRVFVEGSYLSKSDLDVQNALEVVYVDPMLYPHIHLWKQEMKCCTKEEINSLKTPFRTRNLSAQRNLPKSEPSKRQLDMATTPVNTSATWEGWRTAPKRMVNTQLKPKNIYDCLQSWEETLD